MRLLWISLVVFLFLNESVSAAVVIRRRPISIHERASHTTTAATTTTTTTVEPEIYEEQKEEEEEVVDNRLSHMTLPSNATSIRSDITDNFSCFGRSYGYYADIENDCQIFHVCLPVTYPDGREQQFRWSFICPEETAFDQEAFTCVRADEMRTDCSESERFYVLNRILGIKEEVNTEEVTTNEISEHFKLNQNVNNQRFRATPPSSTINPVRFTSQEGLFRNPAYRRPPVAVELNSILENTEKSIPLYTRFPERISIDLNREATVFSARDDQTTPNRELTTANFDSFDSATTTTTTANFNANENSDYTTTKNDMNTRIVPDLLEMNENVNSDVKATDEIVDTIKHLQNIFPTASDDTRTKRFLFKADSVKNRQKLFNILNSN